MNKEHQGAHEKEYAGPGWGQDPHTQKARNETADTVIKIRNAYIAQVKENNEKIKKVTDEHFSECDPSDVGVFVQFYRHYIRFKIEVDKDGELITPDRMREHLGNISFMEPQFMRVVKERCEAKQGEYLKLTS